MSDLLQSKRPLGCFGDWNVISTGLEGKLSSEPGSRRDAIVKQDNLFEGYVKALAVGFMIDELWDGLSSLFGEVFKMLRDRRRER